MSNQRVCVCVCVGIISVYLRERGCCCFPCSDSNKRPSHVSHRHSSSSHASLREEHNSAIIITGRKHVEPHQRSEPTLTLRLSLSDSSLPFCCLAHAPLLKLSFSFCLDNFLFPECFIPPVLVSMHAACLFSFCSFYCIWHREITPRKLPLFLTIRFSWHLSTVELNAFVCWLKAWRKQTF